MKKSTVFHTTRAPVAATGLLEAATGPILNRLAISSYFAAGRAASSYSNFTAFY